MKLVIESMSNRQQASHQIEDCLWYLLLKQIRRTHNTSLSLCGFASIRFARCLLPIACFSTHTSKREEIVGQWEFNMCSLSSVVHGLKPPSSPEHQYHPKRDKQHSTNSNVESVLIMQPGNALEVHSKNATDHRCRCEQAGNDGHYLHHLV